MAKVTITIEDNEKGAVDIRMDPPSLHILNRTLESKGMGVTPAEILAVYLRKAAIDFNARVVQESSPIIMPKMGPF